IRRGAGQLVGERGGCLFHFSPGRHVGIRGVEVDPGARTTGAWVVLPTQVDPAPLDVPRLGAGVADHLPNGAQGNRDPIRALVGPETVQQVQVRNRREQVVVRTYARAGGDLEVILMPISGS